MGATAENIAAQFKVSREEQDEFAFDEPADGRRRRRAAGKFKDEIVPMTDARCFDEAGKRDEVDADRGHDPAAGHHARGPGQAQAGVQREGHRDGGQRVAAHRRRGGGGADERGEGEGAGAQAARLLRRLPGRGRAARRSWASGPMPAVRKLLAKNKLKVEDIDVFELNEAFAAQALYCIRELGLDPTKVNPNGGAIALGPPARRVRRAHERHPAARAEAPRRQATAWSPCASAAAWAPRRSSSWRGSVGASTWVLPLEARPLPEQGGAFPLRRTVHANAAVGSNMALVLLCAVAMFGCGPDPGRR